MPDRCLMSEQEVRFKGHGLESIEVQDNGNGISKDNYETIALKHYTSKLSTFDDLSSLQTFGFRGEALSSLCALSDFHVVTAQVNEAPKGTRLDFETSGKLKATSIVASQKGTTVVVEALFANLPVRRRELEKNIKREYQKVLASLQAYACVSTSVKFSVVSIMPKSKRVVAFATKSNTSTRDNIANVFGAKTLSALVPMDLHFNLRNTKGTMHQIDKENPQVRVLGHVSRPVFGEGRQTPDRQMFFVNSRPCTLPQFAKVFNEVYKTYNVSQSPFVFANIVIDTNAYDVNVSPDKKTILLHEQNELLESLRNALLVLFEQLDQTVPQAQREQPKLPEFKHLTVQRQNSAPVGHVSPQSGKVKQAEDTFELSNESQHEDVPKDSDQSPQHSTGLIGLFAGRDAQARNQSPRRDQKAGSRPVLPMEKQRLMRKLETPVPRLSEDPNDESTPADCDAAEESQVRPTNSLANFNRGTAEQQRTSKDNNVRPFDVANVEETAEEADDIAAVESTRMKPASGVVQNAFDRMRSRRDPPQVATITIGANTTKTVLGSSSTRLSPSSPATPLGSKVRSAVGKETRGKFSSSLKAFAGPGALTPVPATRYQNIPEAVSPRSAASAEHYTDDQDSQVGAGLSSDQELATANVANQTSNDEESDEEYLDEEDHKVEQEAKVADLIRQAEDKSAALSKDDVWRAAKKMKGRGPKDLTTQLLQTLSLSVKNIEDKLQDFEKGLREFLEKSERTEQPIPLKVDDPEKKLSLTICKKDFSRMNIVGQFNLGFILASRPSSSPTQDDELFIIDQHASDEKYNFERLQASTTVQNQRLVRPKILDLTAIEEEIILENNAALLENGFVVEIDESGDRPVGQRCKILSLPMSREVTFDLSDLEELIALLGDCPPPPSTSITSPDKPPAARYIPRPSKIRKLFAMRACRSSVMIGKTLQKRQMEKLVRNMGVIDKPWNCPHGRPTMRHVIGLRAWEGWMEGKGLAVDAGEGEYEKVDWGGWLARRQDHKALDGVGGEDGGSAGVVDWENDGGSDESGPEIQEDSKDGLEEGEDGGMSDNSQDGVDAEDDRTDGDESEGNDERTEESGDEEERSTARHSI
ncbi:MAG: hypothetical protein Q9223_006221, partial [Gallowayella weberi]